MKQKRDYLKMDWSKLSKLDEDTAKQKACNAVPSVRILVPYVGHQSRSKMHYGIHANALCKYIK